MLSQGTHKRLPFVFWNYILCLVVGSEALVFHVGFIQNVGAVAIVLFIAMLGRTFLQQSSVDIGAITIDLEYLGSSHRMGSLRLVS